MKYWPHRGLASPSNRSIPLLCQPHLAQAASLSTLRPVAHRGIRAATNVRSPGRRHDQNCYNRPLRHSMSHAVLGEDSMIHQPEPDFPTHALSPRRHLCHDCSARHHCPRRSHQQRHRPGCHTCLLTRGGGGNLLPLRPNRLHQRHARTN